MLYTEIASCRSCHSSDLKSVLDLGNLCVSDFIQAGQRANSAPLDLVICQDCTLVQLRHTVERDRLYRDYYYRSGTNESMVRALGDVARDAISRIPHPERNDTAVLDIGANDGTLLRMFPDHWTRHGFDPSAMAYESCDPYVIRDYFPPTKKLVHDKYNIITSIACFYDVDDPNAFVAAIKEWLHPDGVWVCQMQDFHGMLAANGFDNICHEHLTYWSMPAFKRLLQRHGLRVDDISHNATNGDSIRYIVKHGDQVLTHNDIGAHDYTCQMGTFAHKVGRLRGQTLRLLAGLKGKRVYGYGASTKGNTLLQYYGITPEMLPAIADRNPDKWGRQMVGTHIPIISEELMRAANPDYLFVLPWHFMDSFMSREREFLDRGGQFIVPLPNLYTVGGDRCRQFIQEEVYVRH